MARRGIARASVEATLQKPDWNDPDPGHGERTRSFKTLEQMGGRVLRVVHWTDGEDIVVPTAMLDRNALKHRRG